MKVTLYTPTFFSIDDKKRENRVFQFGQVLAKNGVEPVLYTFTRPLETATSLLSEGVVTLEGVTIKKYEPKVIRIIGLPPQYFSRKLVKDLALEPSDIVHIHGFSQFPLLLSILRKLTLPVVLSLHQLQGQYQSLATSFRERLFKKTLAHVGKRVSLFTVDTPQDKNILLKLGTPEGKIAFIHQSIDYFKMASTPRNEEDLILTVGRYAPNKGLHNLIDAALTMLDTYPQVKFYFVGTVFDKEYYNFLREKIRGHETHINVTGPLEETKLLDLFSRAKLFIFPSVKDTHGLVNLEAMAAGIPIIATKVEGTTSLINDGMNGILVPPDDVPALVEGIMNLWKDKEKRAVLIKNGRETAKRFYWQHYAREMLEVYSRVLPHSDNR